MAGKTQDFGGIYSQAITLTEALRADAGEAGLVTRFDFAAAAALAGALPTAPSALDNGLKPGLKGFLELGDVLPQPQVLAADGLRPEILLLTKFNPLYADKHSNTTAPTPHGELFKQYVNNLRLLESQSNEVLKNLLGEDGIKKLNDDFKKEISELRNDLLELQKFLISIKSLSNLTDFSDEIYKFSPIDFFNKYLNDNSDLKNSLLRIYSVAGGGNVKISLADSLTQSGRHPAASKYWWNTTLFLTSIRELAICISSYEKNVVLYKVDDNTEKKYTLPDMSYKEGIDLYVDPSATKDNFKRFIDLSDKTIGFYSGDDYSKQNHLEYAKNIFLFCLKEVDQSKKYESKFNSVFSHSDRSKKIFDFIGDYKSFKTISDIIANDSVFGSSGNKLSNFPFYKDSITNKKVLLLENANLVDLSGNPENVITGESFLYSKNFIDSLITITKDGPMFNVEKIGKLKNVLDKFISNSYEQFVDLGAIPSDNLNPLKFLDDLKNQFTKEVDNNDKKIRVFKNSVEKKTTPGTLPPLPDVVIAPGTGDEIGQGGEIEIPLETHAFNENSLLAIFTATNLDKDKDNKFKLINYFYCYVCFIAYLEIAGTTDKANHFINEIVDGIYKTIDDLANKSIPTAGVSKELSVQRIEGDKSGWHAAIRNSLLTSNFIKLLVSIFKNYISLFGNNDELPKLLPLFFLGLHSYIKVISGYEILSFFKFDNKIIAQFDLNQDQKDLNPKIRSINNEASSNLSFISNLTFSILNVLQVFKFKVDSFYRLLLKSQTTYINRLLNYLGGDKRKLLSLFEEQQLFLVLSNVDDLYQSYNGFSTENVDTKKLFIKSENNFPHSSEMVSLLESFFSSNAEYTLSKGYNKQIISIGLPFGLTKNLVKDLKSLGTPNAKKSKQYDIFVISIYKMDLLNPFLIYKPQRFLFETSRFPVRIYSEYKKIGEQGYDLIPTRNFDSVDSSDFSIKGNIQPSIDTNLDNAFGSKYVDVFWSNEHKKEILFNHNVSFLLENYLKLISALNVNELTFNLNFEVLPLSFLQQALFVEKQGSKYISHILQPKKFDRVFNILFDPEFEVDYQETMNNIKDNNDIQTHINSQLNSVLFKNFSDTTYVDKDKTSDDVSMNSYFITVETYVEKGLGVPSAEESLPQDASSSNSNPGVKPPKPPKGPPLPDFYFLPPTIIPGPPTIIPGLLDSIKIFQNAESGYSRSKSPDFDGFINGFKNWTIKK